MDIDGSLSALSLDDSFSRIIRRRRGSGGSNGSNGSTHTHSSMEEEIDQSDSDIDMESIETIKQLSQSTPVKQYEVEEDSSFVSALTTVLSPTNIGAKYAMEHSLSLIRRPTLLMNSPVRHINSFSNSDISVFERTPRGGGFTPKNSGNTPRNSGFTTGNAGHTPGKAGNREGNTPNYTTGNAGNTPGHTPGNTRHTPGNPGHTHAEMSDDTSEFIYNPITKNYDEDITSVIHKPIETTPSSFQVHHHHYYYSPTPSNVPNLSEISSISSTHQSSTHQSPMARQSPMAQYQSPMAQYPMTQYQSPMNSYQNMSSFGSLSEYRTADITLPPPWQKESTPKEKYAYIISTYLQLIINFSLSLYGIYLIYNIIATIRRDIDYKLQGQIINLGIEIDNCRRNYHENNCLPHLIVPAMEKPCEYWMKCMNQNLEVSNKSSISAETLGLIINSLIEPLGLKFFVVFTGFILFVFGMNFGFGFIRAKTYYGERA